MSDNTDIDKYLPIPDCYIGDIAPDRKNMDKSKSNSHGQNLLDLCKSSGLRILNGRLLGDSLGYCTCFSHTGAPSVIDYMLADQVLLGNMKYFHVHSPSLYSIHCIISTCIAACQYEFNTHSIPTTHSIQF